MNAFRITVYVVKKIYIFETTSFCIFCMLTGDKSQELKTVWRQFQKSADITGLVTRQFKFLSTTHCNDDFSRKYQDDCTEFSFIRARPLLLAPESSEIDCSCLHIGLEISAKIFIKRIEGHLQLHWQLLPKICT